MHAGGGYLANISPSEWAQEYEEELPVTMSGADFLTQYGSHWDAATQACAAANMHPTLARLVHPTANTILDQPLHGALGRSSMPTLGTPGCTHPGRPPVLPSLC